jgi:hypothetical protein
MKSAMVDIMVDMIRNEGLMRIRSLIIDFPPVSFSRNYVMLGLLNVNVTEIFNSPRMI